MFRTPLTAAPLGRPAADTFSALDARTAGGPTPLVTAGAAEIAASAANAVKVARPILSPRPRLRPARHVGVPQTLRNGRRTATPSGYRPR
ncbi:hypothetical protein EHYA_07670 [Embleya hyalina]|uniref:Uncharacterized protein n=1 Tax=Embleya hyalina TaxID=516124 RepID=A0A401YZA1_9ACTN|nr:hypothetical protein EHYA_07670 [Embleya hyalina]